MSERKSVFAPASCHLYLLWTCAGLAAILLSGCAQIETGLVREQWSRTYDWRSHGLTREGVIGHFRMHRGKWWHYYCRGRWLLEVNDPEAAAKDFRQALKMRSKDKRGARSYGMHFWDYFPNRELGVALLQLGRVAEAKQFLNASMRTAKSARAKFYLNRTLLADWHSAVAKATKAAPVTPRVMDNSPPKIQFRESIERAYVTKECEWVVGTITDEWAVRKVRFRGEQIADNEHWLKQYRLVQEVQLCDGANTFDVEAEDLKPNTGKNRFIATLDMSKPEMAIHDVKPHRQSGGFRVVLTVFDNYGVREVHIGMDSIPCGNKTTEEIDRVVGVAGAKEATIVAVDVAGLTRSCRIPLKRICDDASIVGTGPFWTPYRTVRESAHRASGRCATGRQLLEVASATSLHRKLGLGGLPRGTAMLLMSSLALQRTPPAPGPAIRPQIDLSELGGAREVTVTDDTLFLEGTLYSPYGVASLIVNGKPVKLTTGKNIYVAFDHPVPLRLGLNRIGIMARDGANSRTHEEVRVIRKQADVRAPEARYHVLVMPFEEVGPKSGLAGRCHDAVIRALDSGPKRFRLLPAGRVSGIIRKEGPNATGGVRAGLRVGRAARTDAVLVGEVLEGKGSLSVYMKVVGTVSGKAIYETDVYDEAKGAQAIRSLAKTLATKLKKALPLTQGKIRGMPGSSIVVNKGRDDGLRPGMKLLFYNEQHVGRNSRIEGIRRAGRLIEATVSKTGKHSATAALADSGAISLLKAGDGFLAK